MVTSRYLLASSSFIVETFGENLCLPTCAYRALNYVSTALTVLLLTM
ncbi:MAG: hypothetical protein QW154_02135 [Sulfolobales archaeon]